MDCPWCDQEVHFEPNRVTADCICGTKVHLDGSYRIRCPVCDKHHEGGREGASKCAMYAFEYNWLKRLTALIATVPYDENGSKLPLDMGRDRLWMFIKDAILQRDNLTCTECGKTESKGYYALHVHHIIPQWADGSDHPRNLRTLCAGCHTEIHSKMGGFNPSSTYRDIVEGVQQTIDS